jgi:phosphohistidine swiveling domain-containing protein
MAVIVQKMVQPTVAGTVFSVDLETGAPLISINATWGLGNAVVAGVVTPDVYVVDPVSLVVVKRRLGSKALIEAYDALARRTVRIATAPELARRFTLSFAEARDLARQAVAIAAHFRDKHGLPGVDLEFAIDDDGITMLQARSETALTRHQPHALAVAPEATRQASRLLMGGIAGSIGAVTGRVCIAATVEEAECKLAPGDILVVAETTHAWERLLRRAGGVITDIGGPGGHSAVVMRELRKPALVGTGSATRVLVDGSMITLDASRRTVWSGELPVAVPPAPAAAGASEESLQGVSEEDAWQEACRMTATFVDAGGRRWIGKPAYVVTPFMQTIYAEAHRRAGHRLGVPTRVQVLDGLHLVCFSDNWLWRQQAYALSLDDLDALHQARAHAIAEFLAASQALNPAPPVVEAWIEALIELNAMIGLSYTLYEAAEQMLAQVARTSRIPALVLLQARQAVVDRLGPSETALALREFDRLLVAVQRDDRLQAALHTASATGCLAPLAAVNARFVHQLRRYATRYKVVKADEPDLLAAAVELRLVALLAADLDARHEPAGPGAIELAVEEFFPEDLRLQRALGLAVAAERARQDAHHLRARGHRLTEQRLAGLVAFLQRRGEIATYSGLFAHSPAWLLLQAARYSGSA